MFLIFFIINCLLFVRADAIDHDDYSPFTVATMKVAEETFKHLRQDTQDALQNFGFCRQACQALISEATAVEPMVGIYSLDSSFEQGLDASVKKVAQEFVQKVAICGMTFNADMEKSVRGITQGNASILSDFSRGYNELCVAVDRLQKRRHDRREAVNFLADTVQSLLLGALRGTLQSVSINSALDLLRGESDLGRFLSPYPEGNDPVWQSRPVDLKMLQNVWHDNLRFLILKLLHEGAGDVLSGESQKLAEEKASATLDASWKKVRTACQEGGSPAKVFDSTLAELETDHVFERKMLPVVQKIARAFMKEWVEMPLLRQSLYDALRAPTKQEQADVLRDLSSRERLMDGVLRLENIRLKTQVSTLAFENRAYHIFCGGRQHPVRKALGVVETHPDLRDTLRAHRSAYRGRQIFSSLLRYGARVKLFV